MIHQLKETLKGLPWGMLLIVAVVIGGGVVMVYAAGWDPGGAGPLVPEPEPTTEPSPTATPPETPTVTETTTVTTTTATTTPEPEPTTTRVPIHENKIGVLDKEVAITDTRSEWTGTLWNNHETTVHVTFDVFFKDSGGLYVYSERNEYTMTAGEKVDVTVTYSGPDAGNVTESDYEVYVDRP